MFGVRADMPPPADLSQLTPEQLEQMEQATRAGVEARLQCLRNIQLLLDASVVLMQQYSASAAVASRSITISYCLFHMNMLK